MSYDDKDPMEFLRQYLDRRRFLARSALAAGGLAFGSSLLAACQGKEKTGGAAADAGSGGKSVRISNWPLYIDKERSQVREATDARRYTEDSRHNASRQDQRPLSEDSALTGTLSS